MHIIKKKINIVLCALIKRADNKLSESTGKKATIHRLLKFNDMSISWMRNTKNPLDTELFIVDESSILDVILMNKLLNAMLDHAVLLLLDNVNQLLSIGPSCMLSDIINSKQTPVSWITEIFR